MYRRIVHRAAKEFRGRHAQRAGVRERQVEEAVGRSRPKHPCPSGDILRTALAPQVRRRIVSNGAKQLQLPDRRSSQLFGLGRDSIVHPPMCSVQTQALNGPLSEWGKALFYEECMRRDRRFHQASNRTKRVELQSDERDCEDSTWVVLIFEA